MSKFSHYIADSWHELTQKVTWPTWNEIQQSTVIVLVATIIITAFIGIMDFVAHNVLKLIYSIFS